jgi:hypothetical protein
MAEAKALVEKPVGGPLKEFLEAYMELGFSFFPVEWGQKAPPLLEWKEFQSRKPSREEVEAWLSNYAIFNVAVVCGRVSNLFVVDFDSEEAYEAWKRSLPRDLLDLVRSACWIVKTGKGYHVYVRPEDPELVPKTRIRCREGVDIRGEGSYVIAPPSKHPSGASYEGWNSLWPSLAPLKREAVEKLLATLQPALAVEEKQVEPKGEAPKPVPKPPEELRELDDGRLEELYKILRPFYEPGSRHPMLLGLSGLAAKLGVSPVSIAKIVKRLHDETQDERDIKTRGDPIVYSYARVGVPVDKKALAEVLGAEPYGPSEPQPQPVAGSSLLFEVFKKKVGEEEARKLLAKVKRLLAPPPLRIPVEWAVGANGREPVAWLIVRRLGDRCEVYLRRKTRSGLLERPFAVLPEIVRLQDTATGNEFFLARGEGRVVALAADLEGLLRQLVAQGYVSKTTLGDINLQLLLQRIVKREKGELAPGLWSEGFVDPLGIGLDLNDYGVEGLLAAKSWIEKHYPESNRKAALATVALAVAKPVTPAVRKRNPTFVDSVVWCYGRGGEGKTTLLTRIVMPLFGLDPNESRERSYVYVRGSVETSAQMAFLVSTNGLPLILDEQAYPALVKNADIILSAVVGQGTIKIHAPRYGLLGEVRFKNLRGLIVATNVEFSRWLRKVREHATDLAYARRVIEIEWENESLKPEAFGDIPALKPVLGAVERVWKLKREELIKCKDVAELAAKLFALLGEVYGADLSAYVEAVREVREKWEEASKSVKATDVDLVRERAYEIARQQLGATGLTGAKVLLSILENPDAYGVRLMKPKDSGATAKEREELEALAQRLAQYEGTKQLADALYHLAADNVTRIVLKANGPLVPGAPREFLGVKNHEYKFGGGYAVGYAVPITRFAEIFLLSVYDEQPPDPQNSVSTVSNLDEVPASTSRNNE